MFSITLQKDADTDTSKNFSKNWLQPFRKRKLLWYAPDFNFPDTNWSNFTSEDQEEQSNLELFENALHQQGVEFHTRATNTLDASFLRNCSFFVRPDRVFTQTYFFDRIVEAHMTWRARHQQSILWKKYSTSNLLN